MITKKEIDKFYSDVDRLGLKNPVSDIADKINYNRGTLSVVLNRKREPSEAILSKFYAAFSDMLADSLHTEGEQKASESYARLVETVAAMHAANQVMLLRIASLEADSRSVSSSSVYLEMKKEIEQQTPHALAELEKRLKDV